MRILLVAALSASLCSFKQLPWSSLHPTTRLRLRPSGHTPRKHAAALWATRQQQPLPDGCSGSVRSSSHLQSWYCRLLRWLGLRDRRLPLVKVEFDSPGGRRSVEFKSRPFGIEFHKSMPVIIGRVREQSPADVLGVRPGWSIRAINGREVLGMSFDKFSEAMFNASAHLEAIDLTDDTIQTRRSEQPALAELIEAFSSGAGGPAMQDGIAPGVRVGALLPESVVPEEGYEDDIPWTVWSDTDGSLRGGALVLIPENADPGACVLFIHGGAFEGGSSHDPGSIAFCSGLAASTNSVVVCPDHLLSGSERPFKAKQIMDQLVKDFQWLHEFDPVSKESRSVPARIVLAGDSSGGTQAMSLLAHIARDHDSLLGCVQGCAVISPWLDLSCGSHTYVSNAFSRRGFTGDAMFRGTAEQTRREFRACAANYLGSEEGLNNSVFSPYWLCRENDNAMLKRILDAQVPIWACIGAAETLVGEVLDFERRFKGKLPIEVWLHEGMFHVWVLFSSSHPFPSRDAALKHLADFVRRALRKPDGLEALRQQLTGKVSAAREGIHYYIDDW